MQCADLQQFRGSGTLAASQMRRARGSGTLAASQMRRVREATGVSLPRGGRPLTGFCRACISLAVEYGPDF